ncbi:hypothetical protein WA158_000176 [Blastocystis sp. Blastoise]
MKAVIRIKRHIGDEPEDEILLNAQQRRKVSLRNAIRQLNEMSINPNGQQRMEKTKFVFKRIDTSSYSSIDQWRQSRFGTVELDRINTDFNTIKQLPLKPVTVDDMNQLKPTKEPYIYNKNQPTESVVTINNKCGIRSYTKILTPLEERMDENIYINIAYGADVNFARPCDKTTSLMALCYNLDFSSILCILDMGASLLLRDIHGYSAIDIYESRGRSEGYLEDPVYISCLSILKKREKEEIEEKEEEEENEKDIIEDEYMDSKPLVSSTSYTMTNGIYNINEKPKERNMNDSDDNYVYDIYILVEGTPTATKEINLEDIYNNNNEFQMWTSSEFTFGDDDKERDDDEEISSNDEDYEGNDYPEEEEEEEEEEDNDNEYNHNHIINKNNSSLNDPYNDYINDSDSSNRYIQNSSLYNNFDFDTWSTNTFDTTHNPKQYIQQHYQDDDDDYNNNDDNNSIHSYDDPNDYSITHSISNNTKDNLYDEQDPMDNNIYDYTNDFSSDDDEQNIDEDDW